MDAQSGQLLRWKSEAGDGYGVVSAVAGRRVAVRMDAGEELQFAWPSEVLERVEFAAGDPVEVVGANQAGVVADRNEVGGRMFYEVTLPGNVRRTITEDGLRPAVFTDPMERLRAGQLDSARSTNLRLAASRLLLAHQFDELSALSNSRVEIKPHQVAVVHRVATSFPHRFILADEVGLGKTIEAGLLIKELKARGVANRVLVIAPSGIVSQWQFELKTKFNEVFAHYNRDTIRFLENENPGENVWALRDNIIVSSSFAAWDDARRRDIALAGWDMVVIDEAHHARRTWQGESKYTETNLYRLAEMLADPVLGLTQAFLLLTATPMQLHRFELYSLIELLDPTLFPSYQDFESHTDSLAGLNQAVDRVRRARGGTAALSREVARWLGQTDADVASDLATPEGRAEVIEELAARHRLSEVLIRNRKKTVGGFQPRVASIWEVELTAEETEAYWATTEYVRAGYAQSKLMQNNALGFLMSTFQKLNASSSHALRQSLLRRIEKLEGQISPPRTVAIEDEDLEEVATEDALGDVLAAREAHDDALWAEVQELERLVGLLDHIPVDSKTLVLLDQLSGLLEAGDGNQTKVLIFTQFRATQDYLKNHISEPWTVNLFHGQLSPAEKDASVKAFREDTGPQILISTEAGGEGRNFQFCHILVNYDLPWNPMKVEQRIGRVDRIGQLKPVTIFNFSTLGTIEERVVEVLTQRIGVFQQTIGGLDPILGEVESDLKKIFMLAEAEARRAFDDLDRNIEVRVREALRAEERLADLIMDTKSLRKDEVEQLLKRRQETTNEDMRRFVTCALSELGVRIDQDAVAGVFRLQFGERFRDLYPQFVKEGATRRVTFEPSVALHYEEIEFLAFGHELVDALVARVRDTSYPGRASHRRILSSELEPTTGWLLVYELELGGMTPRKELLPMFFTGDGEPDLEMGARLLELAAVGKREEFETIPPAVPTTDTATLESRANLIAIEHLMDRQATLQEANREQLTRERQKLERFYDYRSQSAQVKLEATKQTFERLAQSDDPDVQRILPVWSKNLENARRTVSILDDERQRRLGELAGRDHVTAQHGLFSCSYIEILPDPTAVLRVSHPDISHDICKAFRKCCRRTSLEELRDCTQPIATRRAQLEQVAAAGHAFDLNSGLLIADRLAVLIASADGLDRDQRFLLQGAIEYYLLVDDSEHDVQTERGFDDDLLVLDAVADWIEQPPASASATSTA
jgi:ATP-dependent helicase HepA